MDDLRWALLILGVAFIAGLGLWEWRRNRARVGESKESLRVEPVVHPVDAPAHAPVARREPSISEFADLVAPLQEVDIDLANLQPGHPVRVGISSERAVDVPGAGAVPPVERGPAAAESPATPESPPVEEAQVATDVAPSPPAIRWPPERLPDRVLGLRVAARAGSTLPGKQVRHALFAADLRHGPQQIFHRIDEQGNVLASVANLLRPGSLIPDRMDTQEYRGLSLFSVLPGVRPDEQVLEELVHLARALASRLGAIVQDEYGQELDAERLTQLRRAVAATTDPGDGAGA